MILKVWFFSSLRVEWTTRDFLSTGPVYRQLVASGDETRGIES